MKYLILILLLTGCSPVNFSSNSEINDSISPDMVSTTHPEPMSFREAWKVCSNQDLVCNLPLGRSFQVRYYHDATHYVEKTLSGSFLCNDKFFTDPKAYGAKFCIYDENSISVPEDDKTLSNAQIQVLDPTLSLNLLSTPKVSVMYGFTAEANGAPFNWGYMTQGSYIDYAVSISTAKKFKVGLYAARNGSTGNQEMEVTLDGAVVGGVVLTPTGTWTRYMPYLSTQVITLSEGTHVIRLKAKTANAFNIAYVGFQLIP